jgi:autotransporter-associated beta strand protein/T5SS/PEP-CTERM-associated repeat protein
MAVPFPDGYHSTAMKLPKLLLPAWCLLAALIATDSKAALIYWDGDTSTAWNTGANWVGGTVPANNSNTDQAGFDFAVLPTFQPNTGTRQINGIVIGDGTTAVPDFTISGATLTIGNAGIIKNAASLNTTITPNITIEGDQTWTNNSSGTLLISGRIANGGHNLTFNGTGFSRSTDRISGNGDLVKAGSGTLLLEGNSTYTGTTFIAGGTVSISAVENLGQRATARVLGFDNGGTLQATADLSFNTRLFQLGSPDADGIAGTFEVDDGTTTQIKAAVSGTAGTGALQKTGGGILSLDATNSYTGGTIISAGTLRAGLGNNKATLGAETSAVTFNGTGATLQLAGNISDSSRSYDLNDTGTIDTNGFDLIINGGVTGDGGLVKTGNGNLTMNSTASHGGGTTIRNGSLIVSVSGSITDPDSDLVVGDLAGESASIRISGGSVENNWSILGNNAGSTGTANMTGGSWTTNGNFYVGYLGSGTLELSGGNLTVNIYQFHVGNEGDGTLQMTGGNLSTTNSYLGTEFGSSGNAILTSGTWINSNNLVVGTDGSATLAISGNAVLEIGGTLSRGAGGTIDLAAGGTLQIGRGGATGTLATNLTNNGSLIFNRATDSIYSGSINGAGMLSKNGSGTLTLTGNNTYTGDTAINSGVLEIGAGGRLGGGSYSGNITNSGTLTHSGNDNQTLSGTISGSGGFVKSGSSSLTLSGSNSYSGNTTLNDGRINIDNNSALGSGTFIINGGSIDSTTPGITLNNNPQLWNSDFSFIGSNNLNLGNGSVSLNASRTLTVAASNLTVGGPISGPSFGLTKNGSGTLILSGSNSYSGDTSINNGILSIGVSNSIAASSNLIVSGGTFDLHDFNQALGSISGSGNITLGSGTLTTSSSSNSSFSGTISGSGGFVKSGSSSLTLSGSNSYSGATTINAGTLAVNGSIASSALTIANGGTLAGSGTVGNTIISSGGRIAPGNSPGILDTGDLTLEGGGGYNWEITSVSGTPGTDWDLIRAGGGAGNATVTATPGSKFTVFVLGNPTGWNPSTSYLWNIIDWGTVTGFDANAFAVDTTRFTGAPPIGVWSLANSGGFLKLGYFVGDPEWSGGSGEWRTGFFPPLTNGADITFAGTGGISTNDIAAATITSIGSITFNSGAGPFTLQANPGSSGYNSSSPLTLGGNVTNNSSSTQILDLALDIPGSRTFQTSPGNIVLNGPVSGAGSLIKTGSGSLFVWSSLLLGGNIEIQQGLLSLNGRTTVGELIISAGAMLGGTGRIEGNVLNRGTVSPGNSIGTLTIAGDYQQTSSGSLDIEIASPSSFDRLVVGGRASLAGTLQVLPIGGNSLSYGEKYAFLQAGSISGSFGTINAPEGFRGRFLSDGSTGTLLIAPDSYTRVAVTPNQRSAAKALDSFISATSGDRQEVSIALDELTEAEYPAAFDQIAPGFYETLADLAIEQAFVQTQLLQQRLGSLRLGVAGFQTLGMPAQPLRNDRDGSPVGDFGLQTSEPTNWSAWVLGSGSFSRSAGVSETPDYRNDAGGFLTGADYRWGENFSTGLYAGYQYNDAKYNGGGSSRGNSALFGGYASFSRDGYYADALVGGGYTGWQTRRQIEFGTIDRTARAEPGSGQFTTALNLGKDWKLGGFTLGPILGAQFTYAGVGSFTETGADSLDLSLGQQDADSLRTTLGGRVAYTWHLSQNLTLVPEIRMLWLHEFLDNPHSIDAALDGGAGQAFGFDTADPSRDSVFAGAGVGLRLGRAWTASAFYNVNFGNPDFTNNIVSLSLGLSF